MKEQTKYAKILLKECLKLKKNQPLFISVNVERYDFARIVTNIAYELGSKDVYVELVDPYEKHNTLQYLSIEELKSHHLWNKAKWDEYAKKDAAFLMLVSETPGLMKDIPTDKVVTMTDYSLKTRKCFNEARDKQSLAWCIAAVPTELWAKKIFPNDNDCVNSLWNCIFKTCEINTINPEEKLKNKIDTMAKRAKLLNDYHFKKLIYKNKLGTDFEISLLDKTIWCTACQKLITGTTIIPNFPSEEIFTSPDMNSANGIVYASKPLCYQDVIINDFYLKFKDGKVIEAYAKEGNETLQKLIKSCKNIDHLGEVALVPYHSPISNLNMIFYETLFDENAACHIALGDSFPECIVDGDKKSKKELYSEGLNSCTNHVDFMIGTKDLQIIGITYDQKEVPIFENGDFSKAFDI